MFDIFASFHIRVARQCVITTAAKVCQMESSIHIVCRLDSKGDGIASGLHSMAEFVTEKPNGPVAETDFIAGPRSVSC